MSACSYTQILSGEQATLSIGTRLAEACGPQAIIFLYGNLGAGKTTLTRGFLRGLGYEERVKSPTYSILESYLLKNLSIYHFDLYRIHAQEELEEIGIRDYFNSDSISLVEWPEHGEGMLPLPDLSCHIEVFNLGRKIKIEASTKIGEIILQRFLMAK